MDVEATRHTCLKLEIPDNDPIFVKGTWLASSFHLSITDGRHAWLCDGAWTSELIIRIFLYQNCWSFKFFAESFLFYFSIAASEEEVRERALQWDQPVAEYIELAERYLGFQQPGSVYRFSDAGDGNKRVNTFCFSLLVLKCYCLLI